MSILGSGNYEDSDYDKEDMRKCYGCGCNGHEKSKCFTCGKEVCEQCSYDHMDKHKS